jgi:hypothetical protein
MDEHQETAQRIRQAGTMWGRTVHRTLTSYCCRHEFFLFFFPFELNTGRRAFQFLQMFLFFPSIDHQQQRSCDACVPVI